MLSQDQLQNPIILGLGRTGLSFVRYFKWLGIDNVAVWDQKPSEAALAELKQLYPQARVLSDVFSQSLFAGFSAICLSPGIARKPLDAIKQKPAIVSEFDIFAMTNTTPTICVTGSNGKSTVCDLLFEMAKANGKQAVLAGNIGLPVLDAYLEVLKQQRAIDVYILEMSSYQLESVLYLQPTAAAVLNITPDHLDRYPSFYHYARVKNHIYHRANFGLYNVDSVEQPSRRTPCFATMSTDPQKREQVDFFYDHAAHTIYHQQKMLAQTQYWHKKGKHYAENVMAALALGLSQGWNLEKMLEVAKVYIGLKHRCQWVATIKEVAWYNDSKATNVESVQMAIDGVAPSGQRLIWIAGGRGKGTSYAPLKPYMEKSVKVALLLGEEADNIEQALEGCGSVVKVDNLAQAVQKAYELAEPGDVVLLSPACTSFDMFKNFEQRGDYFIEAVHRLKK